MDLSDDAIAMRRAISCLRTAALIIEQQRGKRDADRLRSLARMLEPVEPPKSDPPDNVVHLPL